MGAWGGRQVWGRHGDMVGGMYGGVMDIFKEGGIYDKEGNMYGEEEGKYAGDIGVLEQGRMYEEEGRMYLEEGGMHVRNMVHKVGSTRSALTYKLK